MLKLLSWIPGLAKIGVGTAAVGAGAVAVEQATDKGAGGWFSNFIPNVWEKVTETSSPEQGRNGLLDNFFAGNSKFASIMGFISGIVSAFSPALSKKIDNWLIGRSERISEISKELAENGTGREDAPGVPDAGAVLDQAGQTYDGVANTLEATIPDSIDQGNPHLAAAGTAAAVTAGGALGYKALFGGAAAAGAAAPAASGLVSSLLGTTVLGKAARIGVLAGAGMLATDAALDAQPVATGPHAPAPVSITQDTAGFFADMKNGVGELFTTNADGRTVVDWKDVGDAAQNNAKAAALGAGGTLGWIGGQITDIAESVEEFVGVSDFIDGNTDYSTKWSADITEAGTNFMEANIWGGAPDMNGSWAQAASFGGGMVAGGGALGAAAKGLSIAGRLTSLFTSQANFQAATTSTTATIAGPTLRMAGPN